MPAAAEGFFNQHMPKIIFFFSYLIIPSYAAMF